MTAPRYLRLLTLDTGDQRDLYLGEVDDDAVAMLRPLLDRAVAGETVSLACDPPCTIAAVTFRGRGLVADVELSGRTGTVYVAPSSLAGAALWRAIGHGGVPPPSAPWVASVRRLDDMSLRIALAWLSR